MPCNRKTITELRYETASIYSHLQNQQLDAIQFDIVSMLGELAASGHTDPEVTHKSADIMTSFI